MSQLFQSGALRKSSELFEKLARAEPTRAAYWYNLGNSLYKLGKYSEAHAAYQRVVELQGPSYRRPGSISRRV